MPMNGTEKDQQDAVVSKTIASESPQRFRTENRPWVRSLQRSNTVTLGNYLDQMYMDPASLLSIEDQQDVSIAKTIDNESPLCFRMENNPVVKAFPRTNTVTLGDILDPTYMDPSLWKNMPLHIVELILSKVPFRNLVNLRRVCKYWNALILSEGFSPPFVPALIMFARTPTVRKMMWERNQPVPEARDRRRWSIFRLWSGARRMFKRKPCRGYARGMVHYH